MTMASETLPIRLAVFDLDGVVFDSSALVAPAIWDSLDRLEAATPGLCLRRPTEPEVFGMLGLPNSRYVQALGYDLEPGQWALLKDWVEEREVELIGAGVGTLYEGIEALLTRLGDRGVRCVVASNCGRRYLEAIFVRFGLGRWVDGARCNDDYPRGGKADLIRILLDLTGVTAEQTVYLGDRDFDLYAAREAGTRFVACRWGFGREDRFPDGIAFADRPGEVPVHLGL